MPHRPSTAAATGAALCPRPERAIVTPERDAETLEDMTRAIVRMLWDGIDPVTEQDLQVRHGFTAREIAAHGDAARAEARRRVRAARAEG